MTGQTHEDLRELVTLYVLGALEPPDRAAVEAHLKTCDECAAEARSFVPVIDGLMQTVPLVEPPAGLRDRVLSIAGQPTAVAVKPAASLPPRRQPALAPWLAAAAGLVAACGLAWYAWDLRGRMSALESRLDQAIFRAESAERRVQTAESAASEARLTVAVLAAPDLARVELAGQPPAQNAHGRAFWSRSRGLVFTASNLPALPADRVYQLWVVTPEAPVNAGLLQPDDSGAVSVFTETPLDIGTPIAMAVTVEPAGGVPAPTGDKYLIGVPSAGI